MPMRVVCAGLATVDLVHRVRRTPGPDEKVEALAVEIAAGGPAANAAVAAAALGARVTLVTAVGAHPLGDLIRADLTACGVDVLDATPDATGPPPVSAVTVAESGERSIVSRNAADARVDVPHGLDRIARAADAVLVDGHHAGLAVAAALAARLLVVDAGSWKPVFAEVLPRADVVACSAAFRHPEARPVSTGGARDGSGRPGNGSGRPGNGTGRPGNGTGGPRYGTGGPGRGGPWDADAATAAALRAAGVPHVAITHGRDPVRWWSGDRSGTVPVPPVAAVDTAGAGDVFHGALAVALARGVHALPEALRYAVAVAGVRVAHAGPRAWLADPRLVALST
jgi:sugar/nucleoside kinase (ribokinase family)